MIKKNKMVKRFGLYTIIMNGKVPELVLVDENTAISALGADNAKLRTALGVISGYDQGTVVVIDGKTYNPAERMMQIAADALDEIKEEKKK